MEQADIVISGLSVGYVRRVVASGLSATIESSRLTCLIGPNGVGKSTLLRTISGYQHPLAGSVMVAGRDVRILSGSERARLVSVVLTARPHVARMSVAEMVGLGRQPLTGFMGTLHERDRRAVAEAMAMTGTTQLADRSTDSLSDGESQKVMIAKALAQQTPVILLDEPTAFLDYGSRVELMRLLARLAHTAGKTILLSTHDLGLAARMADHILEMSAGGLEVLDSEQLRLKMDRMESGKR